MPTLARNSVPPQSIVQPPSEDAELSQLEKQLPPLLSVIAGMVDLIGFFTLGHVFTAHVTGNLVVTAAAAVHAGPFNTAQALAIPVFIAALAVVWLIAEASHRHGPDLGRLLLIVQFLLLAAVLIFAVVTRPSSDPGGLAAGITMMIAVSAMACQYALLRLALPKVVSTAVMTGNLTNATLSLMGLLWKSHSTSRADAERLKESLRLFVGFLMGCLLAAGAVSALADWAWSLPVALAALAIAMR